MAQGEQPPTQEEVVYSILTLASLFHNTVESFGNIHSSIGDSRDETILLAQLGIEQARMMIWGDLVGIFSPPTSVAAQSDELKPVLTEEGVKRPLYSRRRDERIDEDEVRHNIEGVLSALSYTLSVPNYNDRFDVNGLKPWQQGYSHALDQPAVNADRFKLLEDRYQLLLNIAASKSSVGRPPRTAHTQWLITDVIRFSNFVKFTKLHVDKLVDSVGLMEEVEEVLKQDISLLGDPATATPRRINKLNVLIKACKGMYPLLGLEAKAALQRLQADHGDHHSVMNRLSINKFPSTPNSQPVSPDGSRRPGLFSRLSTNTVNTFRKSRSNTPGTSRTVTPAASRPASPTRNGSVARNGSVS